VAAAWARELSQLGVSAFVVTGWPVSDTFADEFGQNFYTALFSGQPLAEAVRSARQHVFDISRNWRQWAAYHCYVDTEYRLRLHRPAATTPQHTPASAEKPTEWIVVAGTGQYELPEAVLAASRAIGVALARRNYGLLTGGWQGVDYVVAAAFLEALHKQRAEESAGSYAEESAESYAEESAGSYVKWIRHIMPPGRTPDYPHGELITVESDDAYFAKAAELATAVVLIGGQGATRHIGEEALRRNKPVFPLPHTGGDARSLFEVIVSGWPRPAYPQITVEDFKALGSAADPIAHLMQLLASLGRPEPPGFERASALA